MPAVDLLPLPNLRLLGPPKYCKPDSHHLCQSEVLFFESDVPTERSRSDKGNVRTIAILNAPDERNRIALSGLHACAYFGDVHAHFGTPNAEITGTLVPALYLQRWGMTEIVIFDGRLLIFHLDRSTDCSRFASRSLL